MADLAGWPYWKVISLTGQAGAGTDYQIELEIGDSAGGDFHLEGHCTNFPQDIRITDDDGTTLLDYWVEDITADPIKVWVEVKDDLGSNQDIRVYYGKSGETSASNGDTTFDFFDNFPGSTLNTTTKWTILVGTPTVNDGLYLDDDERINTKTWTGNTISVRYKATHPNETGSTVYSAVGLYDSASSRDCIFITYFNWDVRSKTAEGTEYTTITAYNGEHIFDIKKNAGSSAKYYLDSVLEDTDTTNVANASMPIFIYKKNNNDLLINWIFAHKYIVTEPAFSSAGAEQSPTGVAPTAVFYGPLIGPFGGPI